MRASKPFFSFVLAAAVLVCGLSVPAPAAEPAPFKAVVAGSGPPVIFIPGLACGTNVWDGAVAHFKGRYQCHLLTLAGFAGQPAISGPFLAKVRDGIGQYIRENKLDHPVIIGHSLGGMMSYWVAETFPDDVGPIISVDGLPFYSALMDPNATPESVRPMAAQFQNMYAGLSREQFVANDHTFLGQMITSPEDVKKVALLGDKCDPKAVGQAFYDLVTTDLRPNLKNIRVPVLLIGSDAPGTDAAQKANIQKNYADQIAAIPQHKLVFAAGARHFVQLDNPTFFYAQVDAFLKENKK